MLSQAIICFSVPREGISRQPPTTRVARRMGNGLVDAADMPTFKEYVVAFRIFGVGIALQDQRVLGHLVNCLDQLRNAVIAWRKRSYFVMMHIKVKMFRRRDNSNSPGLISKPDLFSGCLRRCCIGLCFKTRSLLRRRRPKNYPRKSASDLGHLNCRADMLTERTVLFCVVRFIGHNLILLAFK